MSFVTTLNELDAGTPLSPLLTRFRSLLDPMPPAVEDLRPPQAPDGGDDPLFDAPAASPPAAPPPAAPHRGRARTGWIGQARQLGASGAGRAGLVA